ncbi:hypothetical protein [Budvicia aquatica]|uniref:hypothetical protein n=1 Tax=Budvicia aquatica TaxID=82979 RepID=UPI0021C2E5C2|nr:hypothetical protein [Budvicia aquatica]
MKVTGLDIVVSIVTLLAIAVMVPMPWLSFSRDAGGPHRCTPSPRSANRRRILSRHYGWRHSRPRSSLRETA